MLKKLFEQLKTALDGDGDDAQQPRQHSLHLATGVLMAEVARADYDFDEGEFDLLLQLMEVHFGLEPQEAAQLANDASETAEQIVSLYEFTELLHQRLTVEEKAQIVGLLWKIAYADGRLDKYEDALVLKISDLLFVPRARVMRLKHDEKKAAHQ